MTDIETREMIATGQVFVTTTEDVRRVRDRAVEAERHRSAQTITQLTSQIEELTLLNQRLAERVKELE